MLRIFIAAAFSILMVSCGGDRDTTTTANNQKEHRLKPLEVPEAFQGHNGFKLLSPEETGVDFVNVIEEDYDYNILTYEYLYNGGGVAIGDINNNGLPDLYFVSTFGKNRLYLNKGNYQFEDITDRAGVGAIGGFKTGVAMVDINGNGLLDIYVCRTGKEDGPVKKNLLYINNGDLTFTERAADYGLDLESNSTHANFFDMDGNGSLDLYLMNHPLNFPEAVTTRLRQTEEGEIIRLTHPRTPYESDLLLKNENGQFVDVTEKAGISNSAYGLSVIIADINMNGLPDIFVGNDYIEPDHLFINNGDGTFTDKGMEYFNHMSQNSMGADIADFNNNGLPDIMVLDMVAEDHVRYKELMNVMTVSRYNLMTNYGYGEQFVRNVLQYNRGVNSRGEIEFSEISRMAGVSNTDWSWGALFADFNNNGMKDLYIANGYMRDVTNLDYAVYIRDSIERTGGLTSARFPDINEYLEMIPSTPLPNYLYLNNGDLTFFDITKQWNIADSSFSSGSAYADLNGDGNLDLVVSNINSPAFIKKNLGGNGNYLQLRLEGPGNNTYGIGAKAWGTSGDVKQYLELNGNRGFLSTSEHMLHFGLGDHNQMDELLIVWPDHTYQKVYDIEANQRLVVSYDPEGVFEYPDIQSQDLYFTDLTAETGLDFQHEENEFEDFNRERLLPHRLSRFGPALAVGDVNGNGLEDVYVGGAEGQSGALFIQQTNGNFVPSPQQVFTQDLEKEDVDALFFDANGNGALDLMVLSGGYAHNVNNPLYNDRLYLNDGSGNFSKSDDLPGIPTNSGPVLVHDFEGNGEYLIFVGGRALPLNYPVAPVSYILKNENGRFYNTTRQMLPEFERLGMITDIKAADLNGNGVAELIVTGEWMPIKIYAYEDGKFTDQTAEYGLENSNGWWTTLHIEDLNGDGNKEIVAGNLGINARFTASPEEPLMIFADDFDNNGMIDPIMCYYYEGEIYPYPGRDLLLAQLPNLRRQFPRFQKYSNATINDIFSPEQIEGALRLEAYHLKSSIFYLRNGKYVAETLPNEGQISKVMDIMVDDFNGDGIKDILLVGNYKWAEVESGPYDASKGVLFLGNEEGSYTFMENREHGLWASHEARKIRKVSRADGSQLILISNSDGPLQAFEQKVSAQPDL